MMSETIYREVVATGGSWLEPVNKPEPAEKKQPIVRQPKETIAAIDIETSDPHLKQWGPGSIRKDGYIIGIGIYCPEMEIASFFRPEDPMVKQILGDESIVKVLHNGVYDLDWIENGHGIEVRGRCEDTMTRETLLDSYAYSYSLDACCQRRGVEGKNKADTIDAWYTANGFKGKAIENLDKVPFDIVGKYCVQDCKATYDLYFAQQPLLEEQNLLRANDIECRLYPLLMDMKRNGIRVDMSKLFGLMDQLEEEYETGVKEMEQKYGFAPETLSLNSAKDIEKMWRAEHLPIEYTATGKPSFAAAVLEDCPHPLAEKIQHLRGLTKTLAFLNSWVDYSIDGHIHPCFYPAKRDDAGTVTGRWSSGDPNMQQVPARAEKHGKEIRSLFIPEDGCILGAFDYKQIEYRVFIHFAEGPGADEARAEFHKHDVDYHWMVQTMMGWVTGDKDKDKEYRHVTKNLNFGSIYCMGARSFAKKFKRPLLKAHPDADPDNLVPLADSLMKMYKKKIPFVDPTCRRIINTGERRGYVRTLSGRRQRMPLDHGSYKLVNYLIQGSAADLLKKGLVDAWDAGVFKVLKLHAQIHDEIVFSIPKTREGYEACCKLYECMAHSYDLRIPIGVDTEIGPDWGHCDMDNWNGFKEAWEEDKGCL